MYNKIRRRMGWIWLLLAPATLVGLIWAALQNIKADAIRDINKPLPWFIIILVFLPIAAGLMIFGYYCINGEYDNQE